MSIKISELLKILLNNGKDVYSEELELYLYLDDGGRLYACHITNKEAAKLAELQRKSGFKWNNFISIAGRVFESENEKKEIIDYYSAFNWSDTARYNEKKYGYKYCS